MIRDQRHRIEMGDRIFIRMKIGCRTVAEFLLDQVRDMTDLLGVLRTRVKGLRGLATVQIRNQSRGWSQERPLMLYAPAVPVWEQRPVQPVTHNPYPFPWETH